MIKFHHLSSFVVMSSVASGLLLVACADVPLNATSVVPGVATITNMKCDLTFQATLPFTVTYPAPPPPPDRSHKVAVAGSTRIDYRDNVSPVNQPTYNAKDNFVLPFDSSLVDPCKKGWFTEAFIASSGPGPRPQQVTIDVPPLGYSIPGGFPATNGRPKAFTGTFNLRNCGPAALAFTVAVAPADNIEGVPAVTNPMPVNLAAGAQQVITIQGNKADVAKSSLYTVTISGPAPAVVTCNGQVLVE